jgi:hypothetical protein
VSAVSYSRRRDCIRVFVTGLVEASQIESLCTGRYAFGRLNDEVENALLFKARNCRVGEFVTAGSVVINYYEVLYSFYVFSSDYHSGMLLSFVYV